MKRRLVFGLLISLTLGLFLLQGTALAAEAPGLWKFMDQFKAAKYVDLTHVWNEKTPHWKGFDPAVINEI
jgi:hypothetical protein